MKRSVQFYKCEHCGKIVGVVKDGRGQLACCDTPMVLLTANSTDAAQEKHVPVVKKAGDKMTVSVGEAAHPMTPEHYIEWIAIVTDDFTKRIQLKPGDNPVIETCALESCDIYAYCNLHGLWKAQIN